MAYLRQLTIPACKVCKRPASKELINRYNAPVGYFCASCGKSAWRALAGKEAKGG